jgi:hypothetical protein
VLEENGTKLTQTAPILHLAEKFSRFGGTGDAERFETLRCYVATYRVRRTFMPSDENGVLTCFRSRIDDVLGVLYKHRVSDCLVLDDGRI